AVVWKVVGGVVRKTAEVPDVVAGAVSADGSRFALALADGQVRVSPGGVRFAPLLDFTRVGETPQSVALSADGDVLAVGTDVQTWVDRGASVTPVAGSLGAESLSLSADGTTILEQNLLGSGQVQRVSDGHVVGTFPLALAAALAPDGRHWAWGTK